MAATLAISIFHATIYEVLKYGFRKAFPGRDFFEKTLEKCFRKARDRFVRTESGIWTEITLQESINLEKRLVECLQSPSIDRDEFLRILKEQLGKKGLSGDDAEKFYSLIEEEFSAALNEEAAKNPKVFMPVMLHARSRLQDECDRHGVLLEDIIHDLRDMGLVLLTTKTQVENIDKRTRRMERAVDDLKKRVVNRPIDVPFAGTLRPEAIPETVRQVLETYRDQLNRIETVVTQMTPKKAKLGVWVGHVNREAPEKMGLIPDPLLGEIDFGCSVGEKDRVYCAIRLYVYNYGDVSADDVSVKLTFPFELRDPPGPMKVQYVGIRDKENASVRSAYNDEHYEYVVHSLPRLDPHTVWPIQEPISITYPSPLPAGETQAVTKDGVPVTLKLNFDIMGPFISSFEVSVWARDIIPAKGTLRVRHFEAKDMMELRNKITEDWEKALEYALEQRDKNPEESEMIRKELLKNVMAVFPELRRIGATQSGGSIYEERYPERSDTDIFECSESILEPVRSPDDSIQMPDIPDDSIIFGKASDGSVHRIKVGKKNRVNENKCTDRHESRSEEDSRHSS